MAHRASLPGVNHAPLPAGQWTQNPDHSLRLAGSNGSNYLLRPSGSILSYQRGGSRALLDGKGHVQALQTQGMTINRGALGTHRIVAREASGETVVSYGPHHGYVERPVSIGNRSYLQRVSVQNGRTSVALYRSVPYGNSQLDVYVPPTYYGPSFYLWMSAPWRSTVSYQWNWPSPSAQGYYARYYTPAATYSSPNQWMTDYVIQSNLSQAYNSNPDPSTSESGALGMAEDMPVAAAAVSAPVTPEVKAAVSAQISQVVASEKVEAVQVTKDAAHAAPLHQDIPAALDPTLKVFVVADTLQVLAGEQQCQLRQGDILFLPEPVRNGAPNTLVVVKSSLQGDCPGESHVTLGVNDLQEMSNRFRENVASAEQTLATNDGGEHLPKPPDARPQLSLEQQDAAPEQTAAASGAVDQLQLRASREESSIEREISSQGNAQ